MTEFSTTITPDDLQFLSDSYFQFDDFARSAFEQMRDSGIVPHSAVYEGWKFYNEADNEGRVMLRFIIESGYQYVAIPPEDFLAGWRHRSKRQ